MRRLVLSSVVLAIVMVAQPAHAGRWIGAPCDPCEDVRQWVVTVDAVPEEVESLAWALVEPDQGWVLSVRGRDHSFVARLTEAQARALLADPRVTLVDGSGQTQSRLTAGAEAGAGVRTLGPYAYDGAGNIKTIGTDQFRYDKLGRLMTAEVQQGASDTWAQTFTYDRWGNRTESQTRLNGAVQEMGPVAAPDGATNRLAGADYAYDGGGNLTRAGALTLKYDDLGMVVERNDGGIHERYIYGPGNERIATVDLNTGKTRWTIRGLDAKVLSEGEAPTINDSPEWTRSYVWVGSQLIEAVTRDKGVIRYHTDHLGTPRMITDAQGNVISEHKYLPFGEEISDPTEERLKFTSHERDRGTAEWADLDYMHARYYTPNLGRFLSVDPLLGSPASPQTWNRYAYVHNNPMGFVDPTGQAETGYRCDENGDNCYYETTVEPPSDTEQAVETASETIDQTVFDALQMSGFTNVIDGMLQDDPGKLAKGYGTQLLWASSGVGSGLKPLAGASDVLFATPELTPVLTYGARVEARAAATGDLFHNFPQMIDEIVTSSGSIRTVSTEYVEYSLRGTINGVAGEYQIGGRPFVNGVLGVVHRFFQPLP